MWAIRGLITIKRPPRCTTLLHREFRNGVLATSGSPFPFQAEGLPDAPNPTGYNLIMHRAANIVLNVTEKQLPAKLLHIFPESPMISYIGNVSYLEVSGFSNANEKNREFKHRKSYSNIDYVPSFYELGASPYPARHFEVIVHCLPLLLNTEDVGNHAATLLSPPTIPLDELLRILNDRGYLVLGLPEALWKSYEIQQTLQDLSEGRENDPKSVGELLMVQKLPLFLSDLDQFDSTLYEEDEQLDLLEYDETVFVAGERKFNERYMSEPTKQLTKSKDGNAIKYVIALFRKN